VAGTLNLALRGNPVRRFGALLVGVTLVVAGLVLGTNGGRSAATGGDGEVRILATRPASLDPAAQSDITGAAVAAQLFEGLTAFDPSLTLEPALARSWDVRDGGRTVVFHLRPGLAFSDGSPLTGGDVVRSWLRLIDPARPSPLASLLSDVVGADDYRSGLVRDPAMVGLVADGDTVTVRLRAAAADFPAIVAAGPFAVVPPGIADGSALVPGRFVGSGGYVLASDTTSALTLNANPRYWAGPPAIDTVRLVTDLGGRSPVAAFEDGTVDYAAIGSFDASWIRYDASLGPELRAVPSLSIEYLGFDTSQPPYDDVRVRQAIAAAVDWGRIVNLAGPGDQVPATGLVPPGIPGRGTGDFRPAYDPVHAQTLLAEAGYQGGRGFPTTSLVSGGTAYDAAIRAAIEAELKLSVGVETMVGDDYYARLSSDPPPMWLLGWVADYPSPNDFLGVLLHSASANNVGRWRSSAFDAAIAEARSASNAAGTSAGFERAQEIVQDEVPVIPLAYADGWALSRTGLLGAGQNGLGILRMAGLAWSGS
jgi:oligopeptide transport system substrate-binding protein